MLYPFKFKPIYKEIIWGGQNLIKYLNKDSDPNKKIGESWEISDHDEDTSIISNGEYAGKSLHWLVENHAGELIGNANHKKFPLLYKFIDAENDLSVQVHPDDEYANNYKPGEYGKTEAWYIVHAKPGAKLIAGLKQGTTREKFEESISNNTLEKHMYSIEVKKGDVIYIPAGRLHAIMKGVLLNEIQQNSDTTFRVYDWGRMGFDGKPRPIHVKEALDVTDFNDYEPSPVKKEWIEEGKNKFARLVDCEFFHLEEHIIEEDKPVSCNGAFKAITVVEGAFKIKCGDFILDCSIGESVLIPAVCGEFTVIPSEHTTILVSGIKAV